MTHTPGLDYFFLWVIILLIKLLQDQSIFLPNSDTLFLLIAVAARGGMETLRPALQRVYMTRASAYRDALKSFIEGYQEGVQQVMEKRDSASQSEEGTPKRPTK